MKNKCFDQGIIQAYVDGELASDISKNVVRHSAGCNECALMLVKTEEENEFAFSVLEEQLGVFVPTERLREKVFASIKEIEQQEKRSIWTTLTESFALFEAINFRNPSVLALGCTLMFVGTFALAMKFFPRVPDSREVAVDNGEFHVLEGVIDRRGGNSSESTASKPTKADEQKPNRITRIIAGRAPNRVSRQRSGYRYTKAVAKQKAVVKKSTPNVQAVAGEDVYLQTIASLDKNIQISKSEILAPGERVSFEKDLAIVNVAIAKLRDEVRKNPKNEAAKHILKATYQNKIDLLNSVAEKNELIASMQ